LGNREQHVRERIRSVHQEISTEAPLLFFILVSMAVVFAISAIQVKSLLFAFSLVTSALWRKRIGHDPYIFASPLLLLNIILIVSYGFPAIISAFQPTDFTILSKPSDSAYLSMSLDVIAISWLAFSFGWLLLTIISKREGDSSPSVAVPKTALAEPSVGSFARILLLAWLVSPALTMLQVGAIPMAYREGLQSTGHSSSFAMILDYLNNIGYGGVVLFLAVPISSARRYTLKPLFFLGLAFHILFIMGNGAKLPIILLLLSVVMGLEVHRASGQGSRRSLRIAYLLMFLGGAFAFRVVGPYRALANANFAVGLPQDPLKRVRAQVELFGEAVLMLGENEDSDELQRVGESATQRLSSLSALSRVLSYLGGSPSYDHLQTVPLVPLYAILPRDMVENKVTYIESGEFARLNGWKFGGISVTLPGSLYWTAGYFGVIVGFVVFGLLYGWMWRRALSNRRNACVYLVFSVLIGLQLWEPGWDAMIINSERYAILLFGVYKIVSRTHSGRFRWKAVPTLVGQS
jgi:hypothetical protein